MSTERRPQEQGEAASLHRRGLSTCVSVSETGLDGSPFVCCVCVIQQGSLQKEF